MPPPAHLISVVIPTLNEARRIEATLEAVAAQAGPAEVLVADGGSTDETAARAEGRARVLTAPPGRAVQMNAGAAQARGDVLLFLHADTLLPPDGLEAIRRALADPHVQAGTFRLRFDRETPLLRFYSLCTRLPFPHFCFGDRGLFVRRAAFEAVGGFPPLPIFEDLEMVRRLVRRGGFRYLEPAVITAARRYEAHGPLRQQLRNAGLWLRYLAGTDPRRLAPLYTYDGQR